MPGYLLTWNPSRWNWTDFSTAVRDVRDGRGHEMRWSTGNNRNIKAGDRLFLLRQSLDRGLIGSGIASSGVYAGKHWDPQRPDPAHFVSVRFEHLLRPAARLPIEALNDQIPEFRWGAVLASGVRIPASLSQRFELLWAEHLGTVRAVAIPFTLGEYYTLPTLSDILQIPESERNASWKGNCLRHGDDWFLIVDKNDARDAGSLANYWDNEELIWRAPARFRVGTPTVSSLLNPPGHIFVFTRDRDRDQLRFAGTAEPVAHQPTVPVTIRWRLNVTEDPRYDHLPGEMTRAENYREGAVRTVQVNAYERNPAAREACIRHYGTACLVCGLDFGRVYGPLGEGFIHVHHLRELASIGHEYVIDPVLDLRPVCPNCHAMLHTRIPAWTIEEIQARLTCR